jgi:hypothetical protein
MVAALDGCGIAAFKRPICVAMQRVHLTARDNWTILGAT